MLTMPIKGVLFDKDGTLIQFHSFWIPIAEAFTDNLLAKLGASEQAAGLKERLLRSVGLEHGKVDAKGILAGGTTADLAEAYANVLTECAFGAKQTEGLLAWMMDELFRLTQLHRDRLLPTADLDLLLNRMKDQRMKLGIATADDLESTLFFLNKYDIAHRFDFIGTSDRYEKKPNPDMLDRFCEQTGLHPTEVAVVGDTLTDMMFARNAKAGLAIGVLSGTSEHSVLAPHAGLVLQSVGDLIAADGKAAWAELYAKVE